MGARHVRNATAGDVAAMAELADAKRRRYRDHARRFQIPAPNARAAHEAFLPRLLQWDAFSVLVHQTAGAVDGFVVARLGAAPPPFGEGSLFHVDDFVVARDDEWPSRGGPLLLELCRRARRDGLEQAIVVSGPASVDPAKVRFLRELGLAVAAEWWVKPVSPEATGDVPEQTGFAAEVGPAPPVYDPGGPTCLALEIAAPAALADLERYAAAAGAVVVIVPVRVEAVALRGALERRGYEVASEWYSAPTAELV